jgi:hypothetical protein
MNGFHHHEQVVTHQVRNDGQRVMGEVLAGNRSEGDTVDVDRDGGAFHRRVLEDEHRVEQGAVPGGPLHSRQAEVSDIAHRRRFLLQTSAFRHHRSVRIQFERERDRIEEQPDDAIDPGDLFGPAGHHHAVHDVSAVGEPRKHHGPSELDSGVEGQSLRLRPPPQPGGVVGAEGEPRHLRCR